MKTRRLWILVGGIVVLSAAFLLLTFHAAVSKSQAEKKVVTTTIGDRLPDGMQRKEKVCIAVMGESPLVNALETAITAEMHKAGMGDIELVHGLERDYLNPIPIIELEKPGLIWTPFFATTRFSVQAGYASNGDTTFFTEETPVTYNSEDGPTLNLSAQYEVSDRSWGLISRPGYHQVLANYLAQQIVATLVDVYKI